MLRACLLLLLLGVVGCGASGGDMGSFPSDAVSTRQAPVAESLAGPAGASHIATRDEGQHPRRIVHTANANLVVATFDGVPANVAGLAERFGGYVAKSDIYGQPGQPQRGTWTIRVPVENYEGLLSETRQLGELRSLTSNSKDVSDEYYDLEARIRNKQKTEARIVALLEEATGNLEQVLVVEEKLDQVREEIERMQGRLRVLTDQTSLATVNLSVEQVIDVPPPREPTYGSRVSQAFHKSLGALISLGADVSIVIVSLAPWLAVLAVLGVAVGLVAWLGWRFVRRFWPKGNLPQSPFSANVVEEGQ